MDDANVMANVYACVSMFIPLFDQAHCSPASTVNQQNFVCD